MAEPVTREEYGALLDRIWFLEQYTKELEQWVRVLDRKAWWTMPHVKETAVPDLRRREPELKAEETDG